jgi:large subunit ribosomal protein L13
MNTWRASMNPEASSLFSCQSSEIYCFMGLKSHALISRIRAPEFIPEAGISMKTFNAKNETVKRDWYVVDATNLTLGRLAAEVASRLRGKHKPEFTPHVDAGDYIIVVNAGKVRVTGNKAKGKIYYTHTGYTGGIKSTTFEKMMQKEPTRALEHAIKGMLPKGPLGRAVFTKLKVYAGDQHPHASQQPQTLALAL